jgi:hypothetical protein
MVTVAVADLLGSVVDTAVTTRDDAVSSSPTVKAPAALIEDAEVAAPVFVRTDQVTPCGMLGVPSTRAVKTSHVPILMDVVFGVMVTPVTILEGISLRNTITVLDAVGYALDVAVTERKAAVSPAPTVRTPPVVMEEAEPPPTDQVTPWELSGSTCALKVWDVPFAT